MRHMDMSVEQHLRDERNCFERLAVLNVRMEKTLERFYKQFQEIEVERQAVLRELKAHSTAVRSFQKLVTASEFPPERRLWLQLVAPESLLGLGLAADVDHAFTFSDTLRRDLPPTVAMKDAFDKAISRGEVVYPGEGGASRVRLAPSRLSAVMPPPVRMAANAFIPYRDPRSHALLRRPCLGDLCIMQSPENSVGRVLVCIQAVEAGATIVAETPFFSVPVNAAAAAAQLPEALASVMQKTILVREEVFAKQHWDPRLVPPFMAYLSTVAYPQPSSPHSPGWGHLCCPMDSVEPQQLAALCKYASFLHSALPPAFQSLLKDDDVLSFLVKFQANAMQVGGLSSITLSSGVDNAQAPVAGDPTVVPAHGADGEVPFLGLAATYAVFGLLSLVEHSCNPNAAIVFRLNHVDGSTSAPLAREPALVAELRALRPIGVGERISISYVSLFSPRSERRRQLRRHFFFDCSCNSCHHEADPFREFRVLVDGAPAVIRPIGDGAWWQLTEGECWAHSESQLPASRRLRYDDRLVTAAVAAEERMMRAESVVTPLLPEDVAGYTRECAELNTIAVECTFAAAAASVASGTEGSPVVLSSLHYVVLLRMMHVAFAIQHTSQRAARDAMRALLEGFLARWTPLVFLIPPEIHFLEQFLQGADLSQPTASLRRRLVSGMGTHVGSECSEEQEATTKFVQQISVRPAYAAQASPLVTLWEALGRLLAWESSPSHAGSVWVGVALLLRHALHVGSSDRCIRAQTMALKLLSPARE